MLFIVLYKVVLTFESVNLMISCHGSHTIQLKASAVCCTWKLLVFSVFQMEILYQTISNSLGQLDRI